MYTYYSPDRDRSVSFLSQQDVVLTTYNVLSTEVEAKNGIMKVQHSAQSLLPRRHHCERALCPVHNECELWLSDGLSDRYTLITRSSTPCTRWLNNKQHRTVAVDSRDRQSMWLALCR